MHKQDGHGNGGEVAKLRRQRAVLAAFGTRALGIDDIDALLQEACKLVSDACSVELVKVLERLSGGQQMLLRAGVNWRPGVVGHATLAAHSGSPAGYALDSDSPVISSDVDRENRFEIPDLLREHGVRSMVNVVIAGERGPWGVLEVDSREQRDFDEDDIAFLTTYANLLAAALERQQIQGELAAARERDQMLQAELLHRGRNLLANIHAVVSRTRASSTDLDGFVAAFTARLDALGRTQDLLAADRSAPIALAKLLLQELEAHGVLPGDQLNVGGPDINVSAPVAQALAMGFHELATNASKHGALGRDGGHLEISWRSEQKAAGHEVVLRWRETGVLVETTPAHRGMGWSTIERSLPRMLGGTAEMTLHRNGLEYVLRFPTPDPDPIRDGG
jgi:two-component sensor histidine kinase